MRHFPVLLILAVLLVLGGCDTFTGDLSDLQLVLDQPQYKAGQEAIVVLDNNADRAFTYDSCGPRVERKDGGVWLRVAPAPEVCTADLRRVLPGHVVTWRGAVAETLTPGTYRFVLAVGRDENQNSRVASAPFVVTP